MDTSTCDTAKPNAICNDKPIHPDRAGFCPTCGQETRFIFLGEQRWPEHVATRLGLPALILQWSCENCHTTLSEPDQDT